MPCLRVAFASLLLFVSAGCAQDVDRAKNLAERVLSEVVQFEVVELQGPIHADILVGQAPGVAVEGPQELLDGLQVTMANDKLILRLDHDDDDGFLTARITARTLRLLEVSGAGRITVKDPAGESLTVNTAGASDLTVEGITLKTLRLTVTGAAEALLSGRVSEAHYTMSGAGLIRAEDLLADVAHVNLSGAGSVRLHAARRVEGTVAGVGKVTVAGDPSERAITASGIGDVLYE